MIEIIIASEPGWEGRGDVGSRRERGRGDKVARRIGGAVSERVERANMSGTKG